jgi:plastocyanin
MSGTGLRISRVAGGVLVAAVMAVGLTPSVASAADTTTGAGVTVRAGLNAPKDTNIAVLQYLPAKITVAVGAPVTWTWKGAVEPHSVTFLAPGQQLPAPGSNPALFAPTPPTGPYNGQAFVNSGLQPLPPNPAKPFTMTFSTPGKFSYYCVIHPGMVGQVNVVASGKTDSAKAVTARGASEAKKWIAEGTAAKKQLVKTANRSVTSNGIKTWLIQMGKSTKHTDVLAFAPASKKIKAGDQIRFINNSQAPHTGTFPGQQPPIVDPTSPETDAPAPGPSPQTLNHTALFNTGLVPPNASSGPSSPPPPKAARSYTYVVPAKGKYEYYCILHTLSGMGGVISAN